MPVDDRLKCQWCWKSYLPMMRLRNGERRTQWQALAAHLADYGGLNGHPELSEAQLVLIAQGRETPDTLSPVGKRKREQRARRRLRRSQVAV